MAAQNNHNSSSAYDLSRFEERSERRTIKVIKNKQPQSCRVFGISPLTGIFVTAIVIAITSLFIYNNAILTEIGVQINQSSAEYEQLMNEQVRLETALESKMSVQNIEDIAQNKLGLTKMDRSQIVYIKLAPEDVVELAEESAPEGSILDKTIAKIKEYLSK